MQKKKDDKKNRDPRVIQLVEQIKKAYKKDKKFSEDVVNTMKELRQIFIELEQPAIVKAIRLVYEYAETFKGFVIELWEEDSETTSLEYFVGLLDNFHNKYNRDEIRAINVFLKARLAGEEVEFIRPDEDEE
jgi:hypothetical protein